MKKPLLFILAFLLLAFGSRAQNTTVTLGTDITASNQTGPVVINGGGPAFAALSRHAALYDASEINATPFAGRAITKIAWYKDDTSRFVGTANSSITIYLKQTTATSIGGITGVNWPTELTGATQVYTMVAPVISTGAGWKEFVLPVPFMWNGTSNIEVLVDWFGQGDANQNGVWRYSSATNRSAIAIGPSPMLSRSGNRPNMQLTFSVFNNDAGVTAITSPPAQVAPNVATPVQVTLQNFGFNPMTTARLGWKVNNVAQTDYTWNGNLLSGQNVAGITIGNQSLPVGAHTIKVYPKTVNGAPDGFSFNDTATIQVVACSPLAGNYTINKNAAASASNFTSFTAVASLLNSCGVTGPVTFTVAPGTGPYNEALNLTNITGTSAVNKVTFEGSGNTLTSASAAVIKLDRASYVTINNLVINQTSTATLCYGLQLIGPSDFLTFTNNTINMPATSNANVIGILLGTGSNSNTAGNYSSNSVFQSNTINAGYYSVRINGLAVTGSTPVGAVNNRFIGNQFLDFYSNGIYMANADGTRIEGNTFTRPTATSLGNFSGVYLSSGCINTLVNRNRFHNTHGAITTPTNQVTVITVEAAATVGTENIIKNNLFYNLNNHGAVTGISLFSSATGVHIYHNTFSLENPNRPVSNTSAIKGINMSGSGANVKFINNIVTINMPGTGAKHAIYLATAPATDFASNRNVLYIAPGQTSAHTGYLTSNRTSLADWQGANTAAPFDVNSVAFNPAFASLATGNLQPTSPDVNNIGQPLAAVTDDFTGATRSTSTPDPGAYEFSLGSLDAGVTAFASPITPVLPAIATPVTVTIKNFGTAALTSATIGWKVNGVMQPDFAWTGNLAQNTTATATIGNFTFTAGNATVCAWTKSPNSGTDSNAANDSTCTSLNVCAPMAGTYTINKNAPNSATNFVSFSAAAERLHNCGVSARVRINVVTGTGPYTEQVDLLQIPGASATNSVVFNGNGNTLTAAPTAVKTTVVKFDNADFVRLNNLNITLTGTGGVGNPTFSAIQLINNSDNDTISNCTITVPQTAALNAFVMGIFAGVPGASPSGQDLNGLGNNTSNSVFMNNTITGGLYGIKLNGNTNGTNGVNNRVTGNTIVDAYAYGIALDNADGSLVENNEIKRPTHSNPGTFYGISLNGASRNTTISKNRIHDLWPFAVSLGDSYGLYFSGLGAPTGSENKVVNNLVHDTNGPKLSYGIYNNDFGGTYFYHNTITAYPNGGFYGYYQTAGAASNIKFNNNVVAMTGGGGSLNIYALYLANAIETNNNAFYINPTLTNINYGFFGGTSYATLATWKTANSNAFDQQSVQANPMFRVSGNGNLIPSSPLLNNIGKPLPAVPFDMLNVARNAATPDPGAYEFTPSTADAAVVAVVSPVTGCGLTGQETVTITLQNFASVSPAAIPVSFKVDNGATVVENFTGNLPFNATANYTFTAKANLSGPGAHKIFIRTQLPGDTDPSNDTITVHLTNSLQATYPVNLDFETPTSGLASLIRTTNANSAITDGAGASNGTGSTKGMIMDGVDHTGWIIPGGTSSPWNMNPENFAGAYLCLSNAGASPTDTLRLTFDLKQLFKASNANTNFRITVNGTQVGPTYRPPFSGGTPVWQKITVDLSSYLSLPTMQVGFESNVKEAYANGTGTANLLDNIRFVRITGPNGVKENALLQQVAVYPNPSSGLFRVSLPVGETFQLTVSDLSGKTHKTMRATSENAALDLAGAAKGIYLLKITGNAGSTVRRLILE